MAQSFNEIDIRDIAKKIVSNKDVRTTEEFILARLDYNEEMDFLKHPCRFNGYGIFYCLTGAMNVEINLKQFKVRKNTLIVYVPGNIVKVTQDTTESLENLSFAFFAASKQFISGVQLDLSKLYDDSMMMLNNPCISVAQTEENLFAHYYKLVRDITDLEIPDKKESIKALASSLFYLIGSLWSKTLMEHKVTAPAHTLRSKAVFEAFVKLATEYHSTERNVAFYADKLYLTPKYLSKLIKEVSGRSVPEWIDSFIILEAKNLLKYSSLTIKEIAFKTSFVSVPSFYKFFKKQTGMTPMEYRDS